MSEGLEPVRAAFDAAEDIEAPEGAPEALDQDPPAEPPQDEDLARRLGKAARYPLNDYGNGLRLELHFGLDLMYVPRVGWFEWDCTRWQQDPDRLEVRRKAQALAPLILQETDHVPRSGRTSELLDQRASVAQERAELERMDPAARGETYDEDLKRANGRLEALQRKLAGHQKTIDRIRTHAKNAGNNGPLKHMVEEAETLLAQPLDLLDAAPLDVNCENGLLRFTVEDLSEEGAGKVGAVELIEHHRDQLQTKKIPVAFDRSTKAPRFEAFLAEVQPDPEVRAFLQRWFGLAMTGLPIQRMAFFHGDGANGKSVLVDLMAKIAGDYSATVRIESLTGTARRGGGDATPDLVPLIGARFARTSEPDQGTRLQEGLIKELTGGEPIMVRALHSDFIEIRPIFKLTMSGNHKPEIRGTDDGIWRRVLMVPWSVTIPEERRNPHLVEDLWDEAPGILNWLVEGLIDYLEGGLSPPTIVTEATDQFRQESDPLGQYLAECCEVDGEEHHELLTEELKRGFDLWLREHAMPAWKGRQFNLSMKKRADSWRHPRSGWTFTAGPRSSKSNYRGLRFTDEFQARLDQEGWRRSPTPDPDDDQ